MPSPEVKLHQAVLARIKAHQGASEALQAAAEALLAVSQAPGEQSARPQPQPRLARAYHLALAAARRSQLAPVLPEHQDAQAQTLSAAFAYLAALAAGEDYAASAQQAARQLLSLAQLHREAAFLLNPKGD